MIKRLFGSKILRLALSLILIFLAFSRVDINLLFTELSLVPFWFVLLSLFYTFLISLLGSFRWSLVLFDRPNLSTIWNFTKASYTGSFYSLLFPTQVAGDLLKWLPLQKKYPQLSQAKLLSSSLVDRIIGFTAFIFVAFLAAFAGRLLNISFPNYLLILFSGLLFGVISFYILVFNFPVEKIIGHLPILKQLLHLIDLIRKQDKNKLLKLLLIAILTEFTWITPIWFNSLIFSAGMSLVSVYIFMPIIALILVLPISIAGFGAREQLFLFFFTQVGISPEKALLVSTFSGIITVVNSLFGGLILLLHSQDKL